MSDSVRPRRRQPTRLPHPWDSPDSLLSMSKQQGELPPPLLFQGPVVLSGLVLGRCYSNRNSEIKSRFEAPAMLRAEMGSEHMLLRLSRPCYLDFGFCCAVLCNHTGLLSSSRGSDKEYLIIRI